MHTHQLELALPVVAIAAMVLLLATLRRLLHTPAPAGKATTDEQASRDAWKRIKQSWSCWITLMLPVPIGIAALAVAAWVLAYVGWVSTYVLDRPDAMAGVPPWFGNAALFGLNAFWGAVTVFVLSIFGIFLVLFAHAIGRLLIWPET